jgi:uncharacterized membrane protein
MKTFLKVIAPIAIVAVVVTIVVSVFENKQYVEDETEDDDYDNRDSNCPYEIE